MYKNILIIGPARSGKTTLSRKISKEFGYSIINLDDIISAFESMPNSLTKHNGNEIETAKHFGVFLKTYLKELSEGPNFYNGFNFVIEGTHIDFEQIMPMLNTDDYKRKYIVIGLLYNEISEEKLYNNIKKYDTEDDWTYYCSYEELKGNVAYFLDRNKYFKEKFKQYNIDTYDVSDNREEVLEKILKKLNKKR